MDDVAIEELASKAEWEAAYPIVSQLRTDLSREQYLTYVEEMTASGYRLFGAFAGGELVAVAGATILTNMYYGRHLWVTELVTDSAHRSRGYGEYLVEFLVDWAKGRGCEKIGLSSGLQRTDAHRFYEETADMERVSYVFTRDVG